MLALVRSVSADAPTPWSYLSKCSSTHPGRLVRVLTAVARGRVVIDPQLVWQSVPMDDTPLARLSCAQFRVLQLVAEGYCNGAVAEELDITPKAVEGQLTSIYKVLDLPAEANNRVAAVLAFLNQTVRPAA
jgi:DNA-binding NarL/FixJ family response regulator